MHAIGLKPMAFFMSDRRQRKTVSKKVENPMFYLLQMAERPPPIGIPYLGCLGGIEVAFSLKTNIFSEPKKGGAEYGSISH